MGLIKQQKRKSIIFATVKLFRYIVGWIFLLFVVSCGSVPQHASPEDLEEAKAHYDSGFVCLQQDSLMQAFPYFIQVAEKLEYLPEDMTDEEMLLASRAYYQMAHVFRFKIENNAEIDALKQALFYQRTVNDSTWIFRSSLELAHAFFVIKESDSARYYYNEILPYIDTLSGDLDDYYSAQLLLSDLYYSQHEFDSCFQVQRETIAFKTRRGIDTKRDSVSLGIAMFHSPYILQSKPYLLKVLDTDIGEVERGAIMSLLARIYEAEGNADSVLFCQKFHASYVKAESDRVSDGMLAVKQYEKYKAERDARLSALREHKQAQKMNALRAVIVVVALLLLAALAFVVYHRRYKKKAVEQQEAISRDLQKAQGTLEAKELETLRLKVDAIYNDRHNKKGQRILEVFNTAYPEALSQLKAAHPDLNDTELDICVLSYFPFRMKEIADILDLRENTVSKYRTAIKKKTQTETFEGLWKPFVG